MENITVSVMFHPEALMQNRLETGRKALLMPMAEESQIP